MNNVHEYEFNTELLNGSNEFEYQSEGEVHELMGVSSEQEFEHFLGKVWDAAKKFYHSPQGQAIKKDFISGAKSFGKKMFPSIGKNLGQYIDGARGAKYGRQIGNAAGKWLLGDEQQEAVNYLRVIKQAASILNRAISAGGVSAPPRTLVTQAINQAARPVLGQRRSPGASNRVNKNQGTWIRRGNRLVLQNLR